MFSEHDMNNQPGGDSLGEVTSYLDAADKASKAGRTRLAVHLYCVAFELTIEKGLAPTGRVLDGMNQAWTLAYKHGDQLGAEAIFNDMMPYRSSEEAEKDISHFQELTLQHLTELDISPEDITAFAQVLAEKIGSEQQELSEGLFEMPVVEAAAIDSYGYVDDQPEATLDINTLFDRLQKRIQAHNALATAAQEQKEQDEPTLSFSTLTGFNEALHSMRQFGFEDENDQHYTDFLTQASTFHGVTGPVLSESFFFYGPHRDDVALFAKATAGEIGWPTIEMLVDIGENGNGSIKVYGPFKRSLFGPPRMVDLQRPCILIIHNIDLLQELFRQEEQSYRFGYRYGDSFGGHGGSHGQGDNQGFNPGQRSMQAEILSHLRLFRENGEVFIIATARHAPSGHPNMLNEELFDRIEPFREIEVSSPTLLEREEILQRFSRNHPSFRAVDLHHLASLAQGLARNELIWSAQAAVEETYRESLRTRNHRTVSLGGVLSQLLGYLDTNSSYRKQIEDAIIEEFSKDISDDLQNMA